MARPSNKTDLLFKAQENYQKLFDFIDKLSLDQKSQEFSTPSLNRNIRDVFYHLYRWHKMVLEWNKASKQNSKPEMPAPGYTWKTTPDLNIEIKKEGENLSFQEALELLELSHQELIQTITHYPENILFKKKHFKWTSSTSVGAYFVSSTSSHYDWALKFLKKATKT